MVEKIKVPNAIRGYVRLCNLRDGAIFETRTGIRAVKTTYYYNNVNPHPMCILLESGAFAHFDDKEKTWVREIIL